ncbi:MAG: hypothetical protein U5O39_07360 [Gammaproteobacteria bacterium]|nr:hypothetical protein [Gammaproteobacteria bacterium]
MRRITRRLRETLASRTLTTTNTEEAESMLVLRKQQGAVSLELMDNGRYIRLAHVVIADNTVAARDHEPLLSGIEVSPAGRHAQRCEPRKPDCIDIRFSVLEPAWTIGFFTVGDQARLAACELPRRQHGEQILGLNVPGSSESHRPALSYYVLAFEQRHAARVVHRALAAASPGCGGRYEGASAWLAALRDAMQRYPDMAWQSIHFRRQGSHVAVLEGASR